MHLAEVAPLQTRFNVFRHGETCAAERDRTTALADNLGQPQPGLEEAAMTVCRRVEFLLPQQIRLQEHRCCKAPGQQLQNGALPRCARPAYQSQRQSQKWERVAAVRTGRGRGRQLAPKSVKIGAPWPSDISRRCRHDLAGPVQTAVGADVYHQCLTVRQAVVAADRLWAGQLRTLAESTQVASSRLAYYHGWGRGMKILVLQSLFFLVTGRDGGTRLANAGGRLPVQVRLTMRISR